MVPTAAITTVSKEVVPVSEVSEMIVDCLLCLYFVLLGERAL